MEPTLEFASMVPLTGRLLEVVGTLHIVFIILSGIHSMKAFLFLVRAFLIDSSAS